MFFIKSQPIGTEACACLDMIQVGGKKRKSRGHRATRDFVREFAPPYEVSAGDGGAMLRTQRLRRRVRFLVRESPSPYKLPTGKGEAEVRPHAH